MTAPDLSPRSDLPTTASAVVHSPLDRVLMAADSALRAVWGDHVATRACPRPAEGTPEADLSETDKRHAAALMRVNHVGEVCAQALYASQSLGILMSIARSRGLMQR